MRGRNPAIKKTPPNPLLKEGDFIILTLFQERFRGCFSIFLDGLKKNSTR
jgi:hypothetical protein